MPKVALKALTSIPTEAFTSDVRVAPVATSHSPPSLRHSPTAIGYTAPFSVPVICAVAAKAVGAKISVTIPAMGILTLAFLNILIGAG